MKKVKMPKNLTISGLWARDGEQGNLDDVMQSMEKHGTDALPFHVDAAVFLGDDEWDELTESLAEDRDLFEGLGSFRDAMRRGLILVNEETGESCLVDPHGTSHGAYVGIPDLRGLQTYVLRSTMGDRTAGGVTGNHADFVLLEPAGNEWHADRDGRSTGNIFRALVTLTEDGEPRGAYPLAELLRGRRLLFGGNFVFAESSGFSTVFNAPVPVYDRAE